MKAIKTVFAAFAIFICAGFCSADCPGELGDIDDNGRVNISDAQLCFQIVLGQHTPSPEERCRADVDGSGLVTTSDVVVIYRAAVGVLVLADIDGDESGETAVDEDQDWRNGYEHYEDLNGSSEAVAYIDGDSDNKIDCLVDTDGDDLPDIYWDPDDGVVDTVAMSNTDDDGTVEWIFDADGDGRADSYYDPDDRRVYELPDGGPDAPPTPTPTASPANPNFLELELRSNVDGSRVFRPGETLVLDWRAYPGEYGYENKALAVYFGVVMEPAEEDQGGALEDVFSGGRVLLFGRGLTGPSTYEPGNVAPAFTGVAFPPTRTEGELKFTVPSGVDGEFVFAAAFVELDTGGFVNPAAPVEISNRFTLLP